MVGKSHSCKPPGASLENSDVLEFCRDQVEVHKIVSVCSESLHIIWSINFQTIQLKRAFLGEPVALENRLDAIEALKKEIKFDKNVDFFPFQVLLRNLEACGRFFVVHGRLIWKLRNRMVGFEDDSSRISDKDSMRESRLLIMVEYA
ncbi:hypothetical protein F2Q69_00063568 [Brassica cretica]|uniref:Uncharacterized protein n=1 Tax=Brassica cretica TaxID=69181 RepID=A0A8S9RM67_BRACR|nr:hypothetical protein F2Q69_00063568 [Brassica cretica]